MIKWYWTVLIGIISLGIGYYLNVRANKKSTEELKDYIKDQLAQLAQKETSGRITGQEIEHKKTLEAIYNKL